MKKSSLAAFVLTLTAASMSVAQPPGGERGGREGGREGGRGPGGDSVSMVDRMMEFDKNGDGKISKEEAPERLQSMFARADKNEDGLLTKDEISAEIGTRTGGPEGGRGGEGGPRPEGGRGGFGGGREGGGRGGFGGGQPGGPGMGGPSAIMAALDANKDGELSAAEIDLAIVALKKLDKNNDGKLDRSEMGAGDRGPEGQGPGPGDRRPEGRGPGMEGGPGGPRGNMAQFMLERFDANKDGKLSGDEIPERMRENLDAVDTNKDKSIDKAELEAMSSRFQGGGPGGPGAPGGRGGFGGGRPGEGGPGGQGGERRRPAIEE